jgi:hypothetical protein
LRSADLAPELIAEATLRALCGESTSDMVPAEQRIVRGDACYDCVRKVMYGAAPHPTWAGRSASAWRSPMRREAPHRAP